MKSLLIRELLSGPWLRDDDPNTSSKMFAVELEARLQRLLVKDSVGGQWDFLRRMETALVSMGTAGCFLVEGPLRLVQEKKAVWRKISSRCCWKWNASRSPSLPI
jgi:hypothetical protein